MIASLDWRSTVPFSGVFSSLRSHEADLPAQRAPAQASSWLSCAHGVARGAGDSQTPPCEGPEASVGVARAQAEPSVSLAGLRRRLPTGTLDLDPLPRSVL